MTKVTCRNETATRHGGGTEGENRKKAAFSDESVHSGGKTLKARPAAEGGIADNSAKCDARAGNVVKPSDPRSVTAGKRIADEKTVRTVKTAAYTDLRTSFAVFSAKARAVFARIYYKTLF